MSENTAANNPRSGGSARGSSGGSKARNGGAVPTGDREKKRRGGRKLLGARAAADHGNPLQGGADGDGGSSRGGRAMKSGQRMLGVSRDSPFSGSKTPRKPAQGRAKGPGTYEEPERKVPRRRRPMRRPPPSKLSVSSFMPAEGTEEPAQSRKKGRGSVAPAQRTTIAADMLPGHRQEAAAPQQAERHEGKGHSSAKAQLLASSVPMAGSADTRSAERHRSGKGSKKPAAVAVSADSPWADNSKAVTSNKSKNQTRKHVNANAHSTSTGSPFYQGDEPVPKPKTKKVYRDRSTANPLGGPDGETHATRSREKSVKKSRTYQSTLSLDDGPYAEPMPKKGSTKPELAAPPKVERRPSNSRTSKTYQSSSDHPLSGASAPAQSTPKARTNSRTFVSSSDSPFNAPVVPDVRPRAVSKPKPVQAAPIAPKPQRRKEPPSSMNSVLAHPHKSSPRRRLSKQAAVPESLKSKPAGAQPKPHMLERKPSRQAAPQFQRTQPFATHDSAPAPVGRVSRPRTATTSSVTAPAAPAPTRPRRSTAGSTSSGIVPAGGSETLAGRRRAAAPRSNTSNSVGFGSSASTAAPKLRTGRSSTGNRSNMSQGLW